jgi:DNA-binding NarL/FixJ family response regulator
VLTSQMHAGPGAAAAGFPSSRVRWWRVPFTADTWRRALYALVALPAGLVCLPLALLGGGRAAARSQAGLARRCLALHVGGRSQRGATGRVVAHALLGLPLNLAALAVTGYLWLLVLTTFDVDEYVYQALRAGASGFLLKDASAGQLAEAVRVVAAGDALLSPSVTRRLIGEFARLGAPAGPSRRRLEQLTERETEVLALVARGLSNAEIAARLVVAEQTVKTHVSRILTKLGLRDRAQAVVLAYETGVVRAGE